MTASAFVERDCTHLLPAPSKQTSTHVANHASLALLAVISGVVIAVREVVVAAARHCEGK
jgi:hypothetical protein